MGYIDVVFDELPGPQGGRFIEVEDETGASINFGTWVERPDGYAALRIEKGETGTWAAIPVSTRDAIMNEMQEARAKGYTARHDDVHGSGHLVAEAIRRLQTPGEFPSDEAVKHEIVVAIGLLFNAVAVLDRANA